MVIIARKDYLFIDLKDLFNSYFEFVKIADIRILQWMQCMYKYFDQNTVLV